MQGDHHGGILLATAIMIKPASSDGLHVCFGTFRHPTCTDECLLKTDMGIAPLCRLMTQKPDSRLSGFLPGRP
jgi:hypothetical protein